MQSSRRPKRVDNDSPMTHAMGFSPHLTSQALKDHIDLLRWMDYFWHETKYLLNDIDLKEKTYENGKYTRDFIIRCLTNKSNFRILGIMDLIFKGYYSEATIVLRAMFEDIEIMMALYVREDFIEVLYEEDFTMSKVVKVLEEVFPIFIRNLRYNYYVLSDRTHGSLNNIFNTVQIDLESVTFNLLPEYDKDKCLELLKMIILFQEAILVIFKDIFQKYVEKEYFNGMTKELNEFTTWRKSNNIGVV